MARADSASGAGQTRRRHTAEFKLQAVQLVTQQGLSQAEAARRLGIHENLLRTWKKSFEKNGTSVSAAQPFALEAELLRLRAENERFQMERDRPSTSWPSPIEVCNTPANTTSNSWPSKTPRVP